MGKEIEIRNALFNKADVKKFLDNNAVIIKSNHQIDTYYDNPSDSFFKDIDNVNDWCRIREEKGELSFNFKHWLPEDSIIKTYCDETEFKISSKDEFGEALVKMGYQPNFVPVIVVDKHRTSYLYDDCEVSIDEVESLGDYIEVEYKGNNENIEEVQKYLPKILENIKASVGPADNKGYAYNLLKKSK
jgi:adenylyl cyclase CyaB, putative